MSKFLEQFRSAIVSASEEEIRKDVTLKGQLILDRAGDLTVSYSPFEHIQFGARVVIVGITPGNQQAGNELASARRELLAGANDASVLKATKIFARFSGAMRSNLVSMLDYIGLARWLNIPSTDALWTTRSEKAHFTSTLRFPVFVGGSNYSGQPPMTTTPVLRGALTSTCVRRHGLLRAQFGFRLGPRRLRVFNGWCGMAPSKGKWCWKDCLIRAGRMPSELPISLVGSGGSCSRQRRMQKPSIAPENC
jgi:hypothetical protein